MENLLKRLEGLVPPPVLMLVLCMLMWVIHGYVPILHWHPGFEVTAALALLLVALAILFSAAFLFWRHKTTIDPRNVDRSTSLITVGVYALSRNPIYLADVLLLLAFALWLGNVINLVVIAVFVLYINRLQIAPEERALGEIFGSEYQTYREKVRRWI